eukprot:TRINITY_DN1173_c0_g1_i1.p1 TRINITY_DN1173_c0_g1~~TRINITY_DN1173_c0_g1_i1.p1  ORF type:complete len:309 (+),score=64.81 TRINITY_DN1173_c0_g1_i1:120-929(+)
MAAAQDTATPLQQALAHIFREMQTSPSAVSPKALYTLFHRPMDTPQDANDFSSMLVYELDIKSLQALLYMKVTHSADCLNITKHTSFTDVQDCVQLDVEGCADVTDSLHQMVSGRVCTGESGQWTTEGVQDVRLSARFETLSDIVQISLRRSEAGGRKITARHAFPLELDLAEFCVDTSEPQHYVLQAVIVHQGSAYAGMNFTFARSCTDGAWYRYADAVVTKCPEPTEQMLQEVFGRNDVATMMFAAVAMRLIYLRKNVQDALMALDA